MCRPESIENGDWRMERVERRTGKDKKENRVGKGQNGERKRIIRRTKTRKDKTVEVDGMEQKKGHLEGARIGLVYAALGRKSEAQH